MRPTTAFTPGIIVPSLYTAAPPENVDLILQLPL
jgi:hypothetical protein